MHGERPLSAACARCALGGGSQRWQASFPGSSDSWPGFAQIPPAAFSPDEGQKRPFLVERFLEEFDRYNARHMFNAGITGWAQFNGWRGDTSIAKRVEYDPYYLRN